MGGCAFSTSCDTPQAETPTHLYPNNRPARQHKGIVHLDNDSVKKFNGTSSLQQQSSFLHSHFSALTLWDEEPTSTSGDFRHSLQGVCDVVIDSSVKETHLSTRGFLLHAEHLTTVHFAAGCFHELPTIGSSFMRGGLVLTTVHFHGDCFKNVKAIQSSFLRGCVNLETVEFGPRSFENCRRIESHFMAGCSKLKSVTFGAGCFLNVSNIDYSFLAKCSSLESVTFSGGCFSHVAMVGSVFMSRCTMLKCVRFDDGCFGEVCGLGAGFLSGCSALRRVDFADGCLSSIEVLDKGFIDRNIANHLQQVQIDPDAKVLHDALRATGVKNINKLRPSWSWVCHYSLSASVRTGVLAIHQGITYKDSHGDEQYLPNEVAYEICGYINVRW